MTGVPQGYLLCLLFFGGFIIRQPSMPAYWRYWAPYADFMSHAWHAQMANEFGGRPDALLDGVPILEFYNVTGTKWANLGYEATFFAGFFCFAWAVRSSSSIVLCSGRALQAGVPPCEPCGRWPVKEGRKYNIFPPPRAD